MQKFNSPYKHEIFMKRCHELAESGLGWVAPNPMVGAVVVLNNKIIGEGYHQKYGEAHAEVNAIKAVEDDKALKESTLYVNLEPCSHMGKTPPCSDLIIQKGIPRVVIGTSDPNSLVAGRGIEKLRRAGVKVISDVLARESYELNKRFFTFHEKKRPYIILKWAQTQDGFIDIRRDQDTPIGVNWITSLYSRKLVHKWRSEEQGILVGTNTVILDNPELNLRYWEGRNPVRIILDHQLRIPGSSNIYNNNSQSLIYNTLKAETKGKAEWINLNFSHENLEPILSDLYDRGISSLIIEGGKQILEYFIQKSCWDEARVFTGSKYFKTGIVAPEFYSNPEKEIHFFEDTLRIYMA